jgi:DNA-binding CsgD family transcriptional regulator
MNQPLDELLARVASRTAELVALPAIATMDWCDRAAETVGTTIPGFRGLIAVFAVELSANGTVRRVESQSIRLISPIDPDRPMPPLVLTSEASHSLERLTTIGWDAAVPAPVSGLLSTVAKNEQWASLPLVQALGGNRIGQPFVGSASLNATNNRAVIVVMAPSAGAPAFEASSIASLRAVFPILVQRARMAFGEAVDSNSTISDREQLVLNHLVLGKSVRQIADELGRSPHTVHDHVKSLHRKLNASSRGELIARALGYVSRATRIRDAHRASSATGTDEK